jgi:hypothetical protein
MRNPATRFDPEVEWVIEEACRRLKPYLRSKYWNADPDGFARDTQTAINVIRASDLPDWVEYLALLALSEQTKKRRAKGKPTRDFRNAVLRATAAYLMDWYGYRRLRNEATRHRQSAASIIAEALHRLGEKKLSEKQINAIVGDAGDVARDYAIIQKKFGFDVLK